MKFSLVSERLFQPEELQAWTFERQQQIERGVERGLKEGGDAIVPHMRRNVETALKLKRKALPRSVHAKVYPGIGGRLPVLYLGSAIPWLGIHEHGGAVKGPLLIPLLETRIGYTNLKQVIATIVRTGAGFFKAMPDGRVILFAEYQREYGKPLARFRRAERMRRMGPVRRGEDIPIAVVMPRVRLQKRLRFAETVQSELGVIAAAIERNIEARK